MNKQRLGFIMILCCMVGLAACKNSNSPQAVTEKFLTSFSKMDYATAKELSTKPTWEMIDIMASFTKDIPEEQRDKLAGDLKIKITDTKKESDSTMIVTYTSEPKFLPFNKIRLLMQKDIEGRERWKVDISSLDIIGGEEMYIEEEQEAVDMEMERGATDTLAVPGSIE